MRIFFGLFLILLFVSNSACHKKSNNRENSASRSLAGNYLNESFLEQTKDSLPGSIPLFCLEVIFSGKDSAEFYNGFETFYLKMKRQGDTLVFQNAFRKDGKLMPLLAVIGKEEELTLIDHEFTGAKKPSVFKKSSVVNNEKWKFNEAFNKSMLNGEFAVFNLVKQDTLQVKFQEDGLLSGWEIYNEFEICFAGDCLEESAEPGNIIYLHRPGGQLDAFLMKSKKEEGIFELYELGPIDPQVKGNREKGKLLYLLQSKSAKKPNRSKGVF